MNNDYIQDSSVFRECHHWITHNKIYSPLGYLSLRKGQSKTPQFLGEYLHWFHEEGKYMGHDVMGNRYFENQNYMIGRSRWVEYNPTFRWEYDASQVSPEWYGWLHYKTDRLPTEDWAKYCLNCCCWCNSWLLPPQENLSGSECTFYPYSTTRPKTQVWDGYSICNRPCMPM